MPKFNFCCQNMGVKHAHCEENIELKTLQQYVYLFCNVLDIVSK